MDINKVCPKCMNESDGNICSHCGFDREKGQDNTHALKPYTILSGKYLVGNVIGEGGFGITYIGYDLNLEMKIAIKEFYPNGFVTRESDVTSIVTGYTTNDPEQYQKWKDSFVREARNLAKFSDLPGIVHVRDFFQENNTAYIVMEYVEGETLKDYLKKHSGRLSVRETLDMMEPIIRSLSKVHEGGIIHRDISPDNIMIESGGEMKLIDFGAAREFEEGNERSMSVLLKPGYAPEEQYRTKGEQGPWTDVYALSATIYRCITGVKPVESMERMRKDELKRPSELGIEISGPQENALLKGMAVYSESRIRSMAELRQTLYGASGGTHSEGKGSGTQAVSTAAPSVDVSKVPGSTDGKNKIFIIAGLAGAAVLLLVIMLAVVIMGGRKEKTEENIADTSEMDAAPSEPTLSETAAETEASPEDGEDEKSGKKKDNEKDKKDNKDKKEEYTEDGGIHRYDFIVADVTWEEAYREAENRGGHLVHLNSEEETAYIVEQLERKDLNSKSIFIGGKRESGSNDYYWLDPEGKPFGSPLNDSSHSDYWLPGEPSFNSEGREENYMDMVYRKKEGRWYWNDIPNDIIQISSSFAGKVGYIIEYEDGADSSEAERGEDIDYEKIIIGQWHAPEYVDYDMTFYEDGTYDWNVYDTLVVEGESYSIEGDHLSIYYPDNVYSEESNPRWIDIDLEMLEEDGIKWMRFNGLFNGLEEAAFNNSTEKPWFCKVEESDRTGLYVNTGSWGQWKAANSDEMYDWYGEQNGNYPKALHLTELSGDDFIFGIDYFDFGESPLSYKPDTFKGLEGWVGIAYAADDSYYQVPCDVDEDKQEIILFIAPDKKAKIKYDYHPQDPYRDGKRYIFSHNGTEGEFYLLDE